LKAVIIGGGAISELWHIPAAVKLLGKGNVFVAESDQERQAYLRTKFDLQHIGADFRALTGSVDFAVVATPPHMHASMAIECLEAGIPVLCEKPLANSTNECESILIAARRTSRMLGVCHNYRYFPNRVLMRDKIRAGFFGHRVAISIFEGNITKWPTQSGYAFRKNLAPGGVLLNNGIHSIDFMLWCLGQPIDFEYHDDSIGGLESNVEIKINFGNDRRGRLRLSRTCRLQNTILVEGEKTVASMKVFEMNRVLGKDNSELWGSQFNGKAAQDISSIALLQLQDFINALNDAGTPPCSGEEGAAVIDLIEQCYALKRNRPRPDSAPIPGLMW